MAALPCGGVGDAAVGSEARGGDVAAAEGELAIARLGMRLEARPEEGTDGSGNERRGRCERVPFESSRAASQSRSEGNREAVGRTAQRLQREGEIVRTLKAILRILLQTPRDDQIESGDGRGTEVLQAGGIVVENRAHRRDDRRLRRATAPARCSRRCR